MTREESIQQAQRIEKFNRLSKTFDTAHRALVKITEDWPEGPAGQGPFTGNTRESRLIESMTINFTKTQGGAPAMQMDISELHVQAYEVGKVLEEMLRKKMAILKKEMDEL